MEILTVQNKLRLLAGVLKSGSLPGPANTCELAADAMDDQAARIAELEAVVERLRQYGGEAVSELEDIYDGAPDSETGSWPSIIDGFRNAERRADEVSKV